jgi:hypothetical protein
MVRLRNRSVNNDPHASMITRDAAQVADILSFADRTSCRLNRVAAAAPFAAYGFQHPFRNRHPVRCQSSPEYASVSGTGKHIRSGCDSAPPDVILRPECARVSRSLSRLSTTVVRGRSFACAPGSQSQQMCLLAKLITCAVILCPADTRQAEDLIRLAVIENRRDSSLRPGTTGHRNGCRCHFQCGPQRRMTRDWAGCHSIQLLG